MYKISKHNLDTTRYVEEPANPEVTGEILVLASVADVAARLGDDVPSGLTKRAAEEWIEGAVSTGAVVLDEATHADLVKYLTY